MKSFWFILAALAVVLATPFFLRKERIVVADAQDKVIVVSPHMESIRREFTAGFQRWYEERTGRRVEVDFRGIGGTSEITRYLDSQYTNNFRYFWERSLDQKWSREIQVGFADPKLPLPADPAEDSPAQAAKRAFLASEVGCGFDVFFGGGSYDFIRQMNRGQFIDSGILKRHPAWFRPYPEGIPLSFAGEPFYDPKGLWFGAVLSSFGIVSNRDAVARLGISQEPSSWADLADPRYFGQLAVSDPTKSGSINKAFEMILQEQMLQAVKESPGDTDGAVRKGWERGWLITQAIAANARYFTDSAQKVNIDVANGDCAAGLAIDFYGRYQSETVRIRSGRERMTYVTPAGASTVSVDPIAVLRGSPNRQVAALFLEYVLGLEGQALWNFKPGARLTVSSAEAPGLVLRGPEQFALRRAPIAPFFYSPEVLSCRSDPNVNPYVEAGDFVYHPEWTSQVFSERAFIFRVVFIDLSQELREAWESLIKAGFPPRATARFSDLSAIDYSNAKGRIKEVLSKRNKIEEVRLARELSAHFREQFQIAKALANEGL